MNDTAKYEAQIVAYLDRIVRAVRRLENAAAVDCGLNPLQLRILQVVGNAHRAVSIGFVADELEISEPTASDSVRVLAAKGLLVSKPQSTDRRIKHLKLTAEGRALAERFSRSSQLRLGNLPFPVLQRLSGDLHQLVAELFFSGRLQHARICATCYYFAVGAKGELPLCGLLQKRLTVADLRSDCPDHAYRSAGAPL